MAKYNILRDVQVHTSHQQLWDFISNPSNLEFLTPDGMGGKLVSKDPYDRVIEGMKATYIMKPLSFISVRWVAEFTEVKNNDYFVDEQIKGPFKKWRHKHTVITYNGSVFLRDELHYEMPFGFWGELTNRVFLKKRLHQVFEHREKILNQLFPPPEPEIGLHITSEMYDF